MIISSRPTASEAIGLAMSYGRTLGPLLVVESRNGVFAILAGTLKADKAKANLEALIGLRLIPDDAFLSKGDSLQNVVWHSYEPNSSLDLMNQQTYLSSVRRLQASMSRLSFYNGPVDGLIGPSTVTAFRRYLAAFGTPPGDLLTDVSLAEIERNAGDGFRSEEERRMANSSGFDDAQSFTEARKGGFPTEVIFRQAKTLGFSTQRDYEAASQGGFSNNDEYLQAQQGGFVSAYQMKAAQRIGARSKAEYESFQSSGFDTIGEYRTALQGGYSDKASFAKAEAAKLKAARASAEVMLSDAEGFLKLNRDIPNIVEIADRASTLSAEIKSGGAASLEASTARFASLLSDVPGFPPFAEVRKKERAEARNAEVLSILADLKTTKDLLSRWASTHLTSPKLPDVVGELKAVDAVLGSNDLDALSEARDGVRSLITSRNLEADLNELRVPSNEDKGPSSAARAPVTVTNANKVLLEGSLDDVAVLYNASPTAPSLLRTLTGNYSLTKGTAAVCLLGMDRTASLDRVLRAAVAPLGGKSVAVSGTACSAETLKEADLLLIQKRKFSEAQTSLAMGILDALERGVVKPFEPIQFAELKARLDRDDAFVAGLARDVQQGSREGYGSIFLDGRANTICAVIEQERELHEGKLRELAEFAGLAPPFEDRVRIESLDVGYEFLRKGQCEVFYGSRASLKMVVDALERDGIPFSYAPVWLEQSELTAAESALKLAREEAVRAAEARRVALEEEQRIEAQRLREEQETRTARQFELQSSNRAAATAAINRFTGGLREVVLQEPAKRSEPSAIDVKQVFPSFTGWKSDLQSSGWEPRDLQVAIQDYGVVNWKGRNLEAIVLRATVKLASAERGEYRDECFLLGAVLDEEFSAVRDPVEAGCDETAVDVWRTGHHLKSLWLAEPR
ncbi:peptidoglycan-binding protein [Tianweitania populi]|nr:hypothetical protein [Tianweitania populi]